MGATPDTWRGTIQMSRRTLAGGVGAVGSRRIRFDFVFEGRRYRPSVVRAPTETNLRRARDQLASIKARIAADTFSFADEFPAFRGLERVPDAGSPSTCGQVFDAFLKHCESRMRKDDMAAITVATYRRVPDNFWRPKIGEARFLSVRYSMLVRIADEARWSKKTYNNAISVLRRAFKFGYRDHHDHLFFKKAGEPIRNLQYAHARWRRTLAAARHPLSQAVLRATLFGELEPDDRSQLALGR